MTTFTAFFQLDSWSTLFILMLDNVINVSFALAAAALVLVLFRPLNRVKVGHATKLQLNLLHVLQSIASLYRCTDNMLAKRSVGSDYDLYRFVC